MTPISTNLDLFDWSDQQSGRFERRRARRKVRSSRDRFGPRGLLIRDPYATQILNGEKAWEIRGRVTQIRGPIVIIKSKSGHAFGMVELIRVLGPLSLDDLLNAPELPKKERAEFSETGLPYRKTYAYVLSHPRWFSQPIPYKHPSGAVTWVRLPDLDLESVDYAPLARQRTG